MIIFDGLIVNGAEETQPFQALLYIFEDHKLHLISRFPGLKRVLSYLLLYINVLLNGFRNGKLVFSNVLKEISLRD